jgi:hypothetical protein
METTPKERKRSNIEQLLRHGGFVLRRDFREYELNGKEISDEEYEDTWNGLLFYLDEDCERVEEVSYEPFEEQPRVVGLYECPVGKVGVFSAHGDGFDVFRVYVGDEAWKHAKSVAIDDIESTIELLQGIEGTEEIEEELSNTLENVKDMPE